LCKLAFERNPTALKFIDNQTESMCLEAIQYDPKLLQYTNKKTDELCEITFTQEICDIAVKKYPSNFEFVPEKFKTYEMCEF
jgi:hypothetical protein